MLFRVVLITLVLGTTVALHLASPEELALPSAIALFAIVAATYFLTLVYAALLPRIENPRRFADGQIAIDLVVTTALVHFSGGVQSGYAFFYPLSIVGAALVRYRQGASIAGVASIMLFLAVSLAGWMRWLPTPMGQKMVPWDLPSWAFARQAVLNTGAFAAITVLASLLGEQLARTGERLETQEAHAADLAVLNQDIIRCLSSGLVTIDHDRLILTLNEAAEEILGLRRDKVLGRPVGEILPEINPLLENISPKEAIRRAQVQVSRRDGAELTLGVSVSPLTDHLDEPVGRIVNFQDLTELRRMEAQVLRAQRLAVVGHLAAGVAHEIRNPLASISGSIELLKSAPQVDDESRALMNIVLREVDRLNGLITDLLDYARPRELAPVPMDLGQLLAETVRVFSQDRATKHLRIRLEELPRRSDSPAQPSVDSLALGGDEVKVVADPDQVRQVAWNLLRNAVEAMPQGGEIVVAAGIVQENGVSWAEFSVADMGLGIAPEDHERIFDPFFTTKPRGTGLGLATVNRIVTEHGGTISVESPAKGGTRFLIRLPISESTRS